MKKLTILVAIIMLAAGLLTAPASADRPTTIESSDDFPAENPCTGQPHHVYLHFVDRIHQHKNNFLFTSKRTGMTSDGFVIRNGTESFVDNGHVVRGSFLDNWLNPETGQMFQAKGNFTFNIEQLEPKVDRFSLRCIGN